MCPMELQQVKTHFNQRTKWDLVSDEPLNANSLGLSRPPLGEKQHTDHFEYMKTIKINEPLMVSKSSISWSAHKSSSPQQQRDDCAGTGWKINYSDLFGNPWGEWFPSTGGGVEQLGEVLPGICKLGVLRDDTLWVVTVNKCHSSQARKILFALLCLLSDEWPMNTPSKK